MNQKSEAINGSEVILGHIVENFKVLNLCK